MFAVKKVLMLALFYIENQSKFVFFFISLNHSKIFFNNKRQLEIFMTILICLVFSNTSSKMSCFFGEMWYEKLFLKNVIFNDSDTYFRLKILY